MTAVLLPGLAAAAVDGGQLVARTDRTPVVHVAIPGRSGLTPTGRLRRGTSPVCGQHAKLWRACAADGRPLCRRCTAHVGRRTTPVQLRDAAQHVQVDDLLHALASARTESDVSALQILACDAGLIGRSVPDPRGPRPLYSVIREARIRVLGPLRPRPRTPGRAWGAIALEARKSRPTRRGPR